MLLHYFLFENENIKHCGFEIINKNEYIKKCVKKVKNSNDGHPLSQNGFLGWRMDGNSLIHVYDSFRQFNKPL